MYRIGEGFEVQLESDILACGGFEVLDADIFACSCSHGGLQGQVLRCFHFLPPSSRLLPPCVIEPCIRAIRAQLVPASYPLSFYALLRVQPEVTVTSLHPPRLCRIAVFSINKTHPSLRSVSCISFLSTRLTLFGVESRWRQAGDEAKESTSCDQTTGLAPARKRSAARFEQAWTISLSGVQDDDSGAPEAWRRGTCTVLAYRSWI